MTKNQQFKMLFENWKAYTNQNIKESETVALDTGGKDMDTLSSELFNFIKSNKENTNKQQIIDFVKSTFEIFAIISKNNQKKIDSLLDSKIPDQPFVSELPDEDIDKLAKDVTNAIFQAYSSEHYTDISADTKDSLKKKGEKFVPGATAAEMADVAKVMAALGIAKIGADAAEQAFKKGSIINAVKSAFSGKSIKDIVTSIKNNPGAIAKKLATGGATVALLGAGAAGVYYLYKSVTGKEQKDLTDAEKKQLEQLQNDPKYKEFLKKAAELEAKNKKKREKSLSTDGLSDFSKLKKLEGNITKSGNIEHNLTGSQKQFVDSMLQTLSNIGIDNPYLLLGILGAVGKESNFKGISEGAVYPYARMKKNRKGDSVPNRIYKRFKEQGFGEPTDEHLKAISGGGKNGPALFNIAYGYQYHKDETMTAQSHPVLVNGKINPALYDIKLPGWKYRGRGAIGVTYKDNYIRAARASGMKFEELEQRIMEIDEKYQGKKGAHPLPLDLSIILSAGLVGSQNKIASRKFGDPTTPEEGLATAIQIVGGLGWKNWKKTLGGEYNKAVKFIKRNFRISGQSDVTAVAESKTATIKIIKGGNNNA